jgi:hypothetical protein
MENGARLFLAVSPSIGVVAHKAIEHTAGGRQGGESKVLLA